MYRSAPALTAAVRPSRKYYYIIILIAWVFYFYEIRKNFEQRSRDRVTWKNERKNKLYILLLPVSDNDSNNDK